MKRSRLNSSILVKHFALIILYLSALLGCSENIRTAPTSSSTPSLTFTATVTLTSSPTVTLIPSTTWTPIPTISSEEAPIVVAELLSSNAGCRLPCWWGIVPGQTRWEEAKGLLFPLANSIFENKLENSPLTHVEIFFSAPYPSTGKFRQEYLVEKEIVKRIEILPQQYSRYSQPKGLLEEFGNPDSIFLGGSNDSPQSFQLILYYVSQGIFALYSTKMHPAQQQEILEVCFSENEIDYVDIYLWNPADSFSATLDFIFKQYYRPFHEIDFVTNLTTSEFYELFTSPSQTGCFKTPSSFWTS